MDQDESSASRRRLMQGTAAGLAAMAVPGLAATAQAQGANPQASPGAAPRLEDPRAAYPAPVSYTHLTLPTIYSV